MTPATFISKDRRISATIGGVLLAAGTIIGGTGATVTLKVRGEAKDLSHDQSLSDHEARLRALEATVAPSLARIEAKLQGIESRLK